MFFSVLGFLYIWSFGQICSPVVFYLFGAIDSVDRPSSIESSNFYNIPGSNVDTARLDPEVVSFT